MNSHQHASVHRRITSAAASVLALALLSACAEGEVGTGDTKTSTTTSAVVAQPSAVMSEDTIASAAASAESDKPAGATEAAEAPHTAEGVEEAPASSFIVELGEQEPVTAAIHVAIKRAVEDAGFEVEEIRTNAVADVVLRVDRALDAEETARLEAVLMELPQVVGVVHEERMEVYNG